MKQHISVDQLNELSEKGREKLKEWLAKDDYFEGKMFEVSLLSIGQMIEFLGEYCDSLKYKGSLRIQRYYDWEKIDKGNYEHINPKWKVGDSEYSDMYGLIAGDAIDNEELADALWEAVKEVLDD